MSPIRPSLAGQEEHGADAAGGEARDAIGELVVDVGGGHHGRSRSARAGSGCGRGSSACVGRVGDGHGVHSKTSWRRIVEGCEVPRLFAKTRGFSSFLASISLGLRLVEGLVAKVKGLRVEGRKISHIARETGVSRPTIYKILGEEFHEHEERTSISQVRQQLGRQSRCTVRRVPPRPDHPGRLIGAAARCHDLYAAGLEGPPESRSGPWRRIDRSHIGSIECDVVGPLPGPSRSTIVLSHPSLAECPESSGLDR